MFDFQRFSGFSRDKSGINENSFKDYHANIDAISYLHENQCRTILFIYLRNKPETNGLASHQNLFFIQLLLCIFAETISLMKQLTESPRFVQWLIYILLLAAVGYLYLILNNLKEMKEILKQNQQLQESILNSERTSSTTRSCIQFPTDSISFHHIF